jgi:SAM-dependent methyltransferase
MSTNLDAWASHQRSATTGNRVSPSGGCEVNLLDRYPKSKRPIQQRGREITAEHRAVAREFGQSYFDGDRLTGYGGYHYHPRFWHDTVRRIAAYYDLSPTARVLDVGCAKGFMLWEFRQYLPELHLAGLDVSSYALEHAIAEVAPLLEQGCASRLPFEDDAFDLVISINTIHNLPPEPCKQALREIQRVSRRHAFVTVDSWRNEQQRQQLLQWNLTALTYMHADDWVQLFAEVGYGGDFYWFLAE